MAEVAARAPVVQRQIRRPSLIARSVGGVFRLMTMLILALVFSIVLEWLGMVFWWPEQGAQHSQQMLAQELQYLNEGFKRSIVGAPPVMLAREAADRIVQGLKYVGLNRLIDWLQSPRSTTGDWSSLAHGLLKRTRHYLEAMANTAQTFTVRVIVLALATPIFVLFGLVGLAEGLMRRDLRRWGGGRESSFLYHHSKKVLGPSMVVAWMLYLAMPFSIHPNLVLLPFAALFATGVAVTTATFKKYL